MNMINQYSATQENQYSLAGVDRGRLVKSDDPTILAEVYREENNIAVWQRPLSNEVITAANHILNDFDYFERNMQVEAHASEGSIGAVLGDDKFAPLARDISRLVDMFGYLFELERVGLRLAILDRAMCPRFHVDNVPCRLVTTYLGAATEWLPHASVNRARLGSGSNGLPDDESGLYKSSNEIQSLSRGDVALLKGEQWYGNQGAGLVHRSPTPSNSERRLLLSLDFSI